jgi:hypothetical protein
MTQAQNPMTDTGDMIYSGDNSGTPAIIGLTLNGLTNVLTSFGEAGEVPYWSAIQSPLQYAVCHNNQVVCMDDEIVYI